MTKKKRTFWNFVDHFEGDKVVWIIALMLILISIVCIFSSTSRLLEGSQTRVDIVKSQLLIVAAGLVVIIICYNIKNVKVFRWASMLGFPVSLLLLLILDLHRPVGPFVPINLNNAYRILQVGGIQVHVFEVVKVAMVLYLAWALDALKRGVLIGPRAEIWKKILYIYLPFLIVFVAIIPGSNSSALFIGGIMFITILLGGGNLKDMAILAAAGIILLGAVFGLYSATKNNEHPLFDRIGTAISRIGDDNDYEKAFLEARPGSLEYQAALDKIRQPYSAKIAIHQGGLIGKGPGQSTQRYVVPDMSEDYMFSFIIEEYGLFGAILVIFLYVSLLARSSLIARNCGKDLYAKLSVAGLSLLITGQAFLHMFVNADIGPMTGQTLPLISHGNSAFLCFSLAFGVILSISRIASRKMELEQKQAEPLLEVHPDIQQELEVLDAFETDQEINDYDL